MKAAILSLALAYANAQTIVSTNNECFNYEGGYFEKNCRDVYYLTCDEYVVFKGDSCNVFTFSDSRITWDTSEITVSIQDYYFKPDRSSEADSIVMTADEFEDDGACYPYSDVPEKYENGDVKNWTKGMCGFKFGISNTNPDFDNKFTVLKDGASALFAGAAMALAATLAF